MSAEKRLRPLSNASRPRHRHFGDWRTLRLSRRNPNNGTQSEPLFPGIHKHVCAQIEGFLKWHRRKRPGTWRPYRAGTPDNRVAHGLHKGPTALAGDTAQSRWPSRHLDRSESRWTVGRYVLMPDHLHLLHSTGSWKSHSKTGSSTGKVNSRRRIASWINCGSQIIGIRDCCSGESYNDKWSYVRENPVRGGPRCSPPTIGHTKVN